MAMYEVFISADDIGGSRSITDRILSCADDGLLDHVSLLANGPDFDRAAALLRDRPDLGVAVHGNLVEGRALSPPSAIPDLVDDDGVFRTGFVGLWARYLRAGPSRRRTILEQAKIEIDAQIRRVLGALGTDRPIGLDSHQHTHMIPFMFPMYMDLAEEYDLCRVRVPREPLFLHTGPGARGVYMGPGIVKNLLLNFLFLLQRNRIRQSSLTNVHGFVGVMFTGCMSAGVVSSALERLLRPGKMQTGEMEILFHPGSADPSERHLWEGRPELLDFYYSPMRVSEAKELGKLRLPKGVERRYSHASRSHTNLSRQ